jgi:hypothetical protein
VASASGQQFRCCPVLPTSRISYGLSVCSLACWLVGAASLTPFSNMAKTRVGVILRETVGGKNKSNNRSVDLENLQKNQWPAFIKKIQTVIQALQQTSRQSKTVGTIAANGGLLLDDGWMDHGDHGRSSPATGLDVLFLFRNANGYIPFLPNSFRSFCLFCLLLLLLVKLAHKRQFYRSPKALVR